MLPEDNACHVCPVTTGSALAGGRHQSLSDIDSRAGKAGMIKIDRTINDGDPDGRISQRLLPDRGKIGEQRLQTHSHICAINVRHMCPFAAH